MPADISNILTTHTYSGPRLYLLLLLLVELNLCYRFGCHLNLLKGKKCSGISAIPFCAINLNR